METTKGASAYTRRVIDDELDELMPALAAISIDGPKGVGKTATASRRASTIFRLDEAAAAELIRAHPDRLRDVPQPILLDEWQRVPAVWDVVRRRVDEDDSPGQFLLTGSATPTAPTHSGAGRIFPLRMRPLSMAERALEPTTVSLRDLFRGSATIQGRSGLLLPDYVREIVVSGFPGIRDLPGRARRGQLDGYIERIVGHDFEEQGLRVRRPQNLRGWLAAYAAASASTASYATILRAATPGESNARPTKVTANSYRNILAQLWILDPVHAWLPTHNDFARLGSAPKHFLADPALAARLLEVDETRLLSGATAGMLGPQDGTMLGRLFESLVALSLQSYAQANEATVTHFRSQDGDREVDFVLHRGDRANVAIEVKLAASVGDHDVRHLLWLKSRLGEELADMVVVYTGSTAYRRPDGVAVVPLSLLGH
jgi:predicted AAA+ superfamily ATPase